MVKLGLVIGFEMPRPLARPRTKVVLPAPTSPTSSMTLDDLIIPFSTRFVAPVVTGLLANSLPVGREMSRKVLLKSPAIMLLAKVAPKSNISCSE